MIARLRCGTRINLIEPRQRQNGQDWYLFTYNRDYHKVLSEYAALCGRFR